MTDTRTPLVQHYRRRLAAVQSAIDHADPLELLRVGAPADEYADEAEAILAALSEPGHAEAVDIVWRVFREAFEQACGPRESFTLLAIDIETALTLVDLQHGAAS